MAVFLCSVVIIMSHDTVTTTTVPVAVVSSISTTTMTVTIAPISMGLSVVWGHDVGLLPPLIPRCTMRGAVNLATV